MLKHMTPAECAVKAFGGVRATARAIGRQPTTISKWSRRPGGLIPEKVIRPLLEKAQAQGLDLTAEDLIMGRTKVEA